MGVFSFVENFFFISLGITFVLILLLVYHFKQRMSSVERKGDTMFELMSNVVKEINFLKNVHSYYDSFFTKSAVDPLAVTTESEPKPDTISYNIVDPIETVENHNQTATQSIRLRVDESDSEESDDEEGEENSQLDSDSDSDESEGSQGSQESEGSEEPAVFSDISPVESLPEESVVAAAAAEVAPVPAIQVDSLDTTPIEMEFDDLTTDEPATRTSDSSLDYVKVEDSTYTELPPSAESTEPESVLAADDNEEFPRKDSYRKMNVTQLKTVVQTLGLQVDVSKMKKNEIVRLLESMNA
jgi:hypothetical protein